MNKALTWVIVAVVVIVLLLVLLAVLPVRRGAEEVGVPVVDITTPLPTSLPTPSPEVLTPEKEKLTDLESETDSLVFDQTLDADLRGLDTELSGI